MTEQLETMTHTEEGKWGTIVTPQPVPGPSEPKFHVCPTCQRAFESEHGLRMHISRSHGVAGKARKRKGAAAPAPAPKNSGPRPAELDAGKLVALLRPDNGVAQDPALLLRLAEWVRAGRELYADLGPRGS